MPACGDSMPVSRRVPALVVGLCSHGLAICRSLGRRGIPVYALESNADLPGLKTRYAEPIFVRNINGPELVDDLVRVRHRFAEKPVLYLTNDHMVRVVAHAYEQIRSRYRLNWPAGDLVLRLLDKANLESLARESGLLYPDTFTLSSNDDLDKLSGALAYPVALKPAAPLSPFKALRIESLAELRRAVKKYESGVARFLVQAWIEGSERDIYFASLYYDDDHRPIASFVGRKVRSFPRHTGGACSAEPADRSDILEQGRRFFDKLGMCGPVSLEIKEDAAGRKFVIEPTVGRFDFWVKCCAINGVDMPYIAYAHQTGSAIPEVAESVRPKIWVDFEKDFPVYLGSLSVSGERWNAVRFLFARKRYAMWAVDDVRPSLYAWPRGWRKYYRKVKNRLQRIARRGKNP